jgi:hypothetical protein
MSWWQKLIRTQHAVLTPTTPGRFRGGVFGHLRDSQGSGVVVYVYNPRYSGSRG